MNSCIIETIYGQELAGESNSRRLRPLKAPKGSSLEVYEADRRNGATDEEAPAAAGPVVLEKPEPSREEEGAEREADPKRQRMAEDDEDNWIDEEDADEEEGVGVSIGERVRVRKLAAQATRTLPRGGGQMR
jgi:hypothetical protein